MGLKGKFERKESFLFSMVQCDSGLQKTVKNIPGK